MPRSIPMALAIVTWWCVAAFAQPVQFEVSSGQIDARSPEALRGDRVPAATDASVPAPAAVDRAGRTELLYGQEPLAQAVSSKSADTAAPAPTAGTTTGQGSYFTPSTDPWAWSTAATNQWGVSVMGPSSFSMSSVRAWTISGSSTSSIRSSGSAARSAVAGIASRPSLQAVRPSVGLIRR